MLDELCENRRFGPPFNLTLRNNDTLLTEASLPFNTADHCCLSVSFARLGSEKLCPVKTCSTCANYHLPFRFRR